MDLGGFAPSTEICCFTFGDLVGYIARLTAACLRVAFLMAMAS
jgi:hypothetical protein